MSGEHIEVDLATFDYRDPAQLAAALKHHSQIEVAVARGIDPSTVSKWKKLHKYGIEAKTSWIAPTQCVHTESAATARNELLEYFRARPSPSGRPPRVTQNGGRYLREVIGCDLHAPLHHEKAWEVFLGTCEYLQPEGITLNGDTLDLNMLSRFVRRPRAVRQLQADLDWARENVFARINAAAPNAVKTLVLGNHEGDRWERYLWERCPEIAELRCLDMAQLLGLDELGWHYEPDGYDLIPDVLTVQHGERHTSALGGGSAMSARKEMIDSGISGVSGHTHHLGKFYRNDMASYRVWVECGCLCDQDKMREHRVTARKRGHKREDWHLGFAIVYHHAGGEAFDIKDVPILQSGRRTFAIINETEITA